MITRRGKCSATSSTKSHWPPRSAILSTAWRASSRMRPSSLRMFCGMNQAWVRARYFM